MQQFAWDCGSIRHEASAFFVPNSFLLQAKQKEVTLKKAVRYNLKTLHVNNNSSQLADLPNCLWRMSGVVLLRRRHITAGMNAGDTSG